MELNLRLKGHVYRQHLYNVITSGNGSAITLLPEVFTQRNFVCSRLYSIELKFYSQKQQICFLRHPLEELGVTYALHL